MAVTLKTAQDMYNFCQDHGMGKGNSQSWDLKHFQLIEETLSPNEHVLTVFEGLHNYASLSKHDKNFAYAVTTKRFIMAQKKAIGSVLQTVSLSNVNDITFQKKALMGIVTIDTMKERFNVAANYEVAERIHKSILKALEIAGKSF